MLSLNLTLNTINLKTEDRGRRSVSQHPTEKGKEKIWPNEPRECDLHSRTLLKYARKVSYQEKEPLCVMPRFG